MNRRAVVILVVLVVVAVAALSGASALVLGGASLASGSADAWRLQARALAWSGVQAALAELADQRRDLLVGKPPSLTETWDLYTAANGRRAVVRLVPVDASPDRDGRADAPELLASEAARLNLNTATAEMIAAVTQCDASVASAIVAARPFASVEDVLRLPGIPPDFLDAGDIPGRSRLTVFSADPNVQAGVDSGDESVGRQRINLNTPWSDRLGRDLDARFGGGAGEAVKQLMGSGKQFRTTSELIATMRSEVALPVEAWAIPLDCLATSPDPYAPGRIDLLTASADVLAAVPGISPEAAAQIVRTRDGLSDELRRTPTWPATQGILDADSMQSALDHVVSRSLQWRVRIEAGLAPAEGDGPLERAMVLEAVLDVASERPRVAYLREIGVLDSLSHVAASDPRPNARAEHSQPVSSPTPDRPAARPSAPTPTARPQAGPPQRRESTRAAGAPPTEPAANLQSGGEEPTPVDRRVGRWTSPGEGSRR